MSFMRTMIEEKDLLYEVVEFEHEGFEHTIPVEVVVEFIEKSPESIRSKVNKTLSVIDFNNGNVLDFIEYLAKGMVQIWLNTKNLTILSFSIIM